MEKESLNRESHNDESQDPSPQAHGGDDYAHPTPEHDTPPQAINSEHPAMQPITDAETPALRLIFDGLFYICFDRSTDPCTESRVGVVTTAPGHRFGITVTEFVDNTSKEIFSINLPPEQSRSIEHMSLDIPGAATPSVTRKGNAERINRHDPNKNKQHYKWIIDLENPEEMHQKPLTLVRNVFKPILRIRTGEFYAQELSTVPYECIKGNMERKDFGYVASIIGVNIAELPEMKAILKLGALSFPFSAKNDQTAFEIKFSNKRPLKKVDMHALHKAHISDFPYYYHAFNVSALERFDFDFAESPTDNTHEGTKENDGVPPAVCYSSGGRFPPG